METKLYNQSGEEIGTVELPDSIFKIPLNPDLMHQALLAQIGNSRKILAHAKGRSEVRGGGRKPWQQKGTGRARHGSIRSPLWKGGGVTHGPLKEKNYSQKINKKMKRKALFMALSSKVSDNQLLVIDSLNLEKPKTKIMDNILNGLSTRLQNYRITKKKKDSILLVIPNSKPDILRSIRNISYFSVINADSLNIKDILEKKYLILLKDAIEVIEKTYRK